MKVIFFMVPTLIRQAESFANIACDGSEAARFDAKDALETVENFHEERTRSGTVNVPKNGYPYALFKEKGELIHSLKVRLTLQRGTLGAGREEMGLRALVELVWCEPRLAWNPANEGRAMSEASLRIADARLVRRFWLPRVDLLNAERTNDPSKSLRYLELSHNGSVSLVEAQELRVSCAPDPYTHPFVPTRCSFTFVIVDFSKTEILLELYGNESARVAGGVSGLSVRADDHPARLDNIVSFTVSVEAYGVGGLSLSADDHPARLDNIVSFTVSVEADWALWLGCRWAPLAGLAAVSLAAATRRCGRLLPSACALASVVVGHLGLGRGSDAVLALLVALVDCLMTILLLSLVLGSEKARRGVTQNSAVSLQDAEDAGPLLGKRSSGSAGPAKRRSVALPVLLAAAFVAAHAAYATFLVFRVLF